jgi:hypothetical protein
MDPGGFGASLRSLDSSIANAAIWTLAKERGLRFWSGADARSSPDMRLAFDPASCTRSAQRISKLYRGADVAMGYVLRAGETRPLVYSFAVREDAVLDGGISHYGRALGYLGTVVELADLGAIMQPETLRGGFAAVLQRA